MQMDIGFELAAYRDSYKTVSTKIQFSLAGFLASQFLLFFSQPMGFQVNKSLIRTHCPQKIYGDLSLVWSRNAVKYFFYTNECFNLIGSTDRRSSFEWRTHAFWKRNSSLPAPWWKKSSCKVWLLWLLLCPNA